jgi:cyclophilin family peptidyl-prolyl cis-trans isomerase/HEAT repeat protein
VRRLAWLALTANGTVDRLAIRGMISESRDVQVRRLAVAALHNVDDSTFMRHELDRVRQDPQWLVRLEWIRDFRQRFAVTDCGPLLSALSDPIHHVRLAAIDALGAPCPADDSVRAALLRIVEEGPDGATPRPATGVSWHAKAHALLSLARIDSANSRELLRQNSKHPVWQMRMYVARGAAAARDTMLLTTLAYDSIGSVREVAIQGLSATVGHVADLVFARALSSKDHHVILAAARALRGAPVRDSVMPAVLDAVDRLTKEQRQTSRDPRLELLARVRELGTPADAPRLTPLLKDVDEAIAVEAGRVITHLNGGEVQVAPVRTDRPVNPPTGMTRVRVTMSPATGGGTFDVLLDADRAPMTVARVLELIRNKYYDGLTFHRVLPNFVLQGGSPGMNEYAGDGPFMRDELSLAHHARGTLGISTRGRDTGDAQWFINMVDNYRLDHDYTVFATVVAGMEVVDRILEGDIMESVTIVGSR